MDSEDLDWVEKGNSLYDQGNYEGALEYYERAIAINPKSADAWYGKGLVLSELGKHEEAIDAYDNALDINPEDAAACYNRGIILSELGRYEEAIDAYDNALSINPKYADAWSGKGLVLSELGRYEEAIYAYDNALDINPESANAWSGKGFLHYKLGGYEEALDAYNKALDINLKSAADWYNKSVVLTNLDRYEEATESHKKAIELDPEYANRIVEKDSTLISPLTQKAGVGIEQPQRVKNDITRHNLESGAVQDNVTADRPATSMEEDKLGYDVYASALHAFIDSRDTSTPLTIGIDGPWGTGKTSLMGLVQKKLDPERNFFERLKLEWRLFKWFIPFLVTLPIWGLGKVLLLGERLPLNIVKTIGENATLIKHLIYIDSGLSYDPYVHSKEDIEGWPKPARFWAMIGSCHSRMDPENHSTVFFNAWKFDQEEQLWAAVALAVMNQIKERYGILHRIFFWLRLTFRRSSLKGAAYVIIKKFALPLIFLLTFMITNFGNDSPKDSSTNIGNYINKSPISIPLSENISELFTQHANSLGEVILFIGLFATALFQLQKIYKDPFQISVRDITNEPDYKEKVGFIGHFEDDFSHIVSIVTQPILGWKSQKLVIFIDDLDRCEPPKSADIVEAINLFLDSPGCIFVVGMDSAAVIACIEAKYRKLGKCIQNQSTESVSLGQLFLDKIIQVPFLVPPPEKEDIDKLVDAITQPKISSLIPPDFSILEKPTEKEAGSVPEKEELRPIKIKIGTIKDVAGYKNEDIKNAIRSGTALLKENPRQVKRFINQFRLYVYIADKRGMLVGDITKEVELNPEKLAIWVALSVRWPSLIKGMFEDVRLADLRLYLNRIATNIKDDGRLNEEGYKDLLERLNSIPEKEKEATSHWSDLPWDWWLKDSDFLAPIKKLEFVWQQPEKGEVDWLRTLLKMNVIRSDQSNSPEEE